MILLWTLVACAQRVHVFICVFADVLSLRCHRIHSSFFVSTSLPRRHRMKTKRKRCIISIPRCGTVCCTAALSNSMEWWQQWMSKHSLNFSWSDNVCLFTQFMQKTLVTMYSCEWCVWRKQIFVLLSLHFLSITIFHSFRLNVISNAHATATAFPTCCHANVAHAIRKMLETRKKYFMDIAIC